MLDAYMSTKFLSMMRELQMPTRKKIGLAAVFLIATTDLIFDIPRTVFTINGGAVASSITIWDISETTVAVMVLALPTYKALLGKSGRKRRASSKENLKRRGGILGAQASIPYIEMASDEELGRISEHGSKGPSSHQVEGDTRLPTDPVTNL